MSQLKETKARRQSLPAVLVGAVFVGILGICGGFLIFRWSPYGDCADGLSGHVPYAAQTRFLESLFAALKENDQTKLKEMSRDESVLANIEELQSELDSSYQVVKSDDLGGFYEYTLLFDNGTRIYIVVEGVWSECPDATITDEEVFSSLQVWRIEQRP